MFNMKVDGITNKETGIYCQTSGAFIPLDPANMEYQAVLDKIIESGASCFEGDMPDHLQAAADAKLFSLQLQKYKDAVERLEKYVVAEGREEQTNEVVVGQEWDDETGAMVDVIETSIVPAIEPVEPTVTRMVYSEDEQMAEPTEETIENPLITKDNEERAAAQAVVDATPQPVKDAAE